MDGIAFAIGGPGRRHFHRARPATTVIDEIKTTAIPTERDAARTCNPCHWAQGMVYGAIYAQQHGPAAVGRPADLLPDRHRRDRPVSPTFHRRKNWTRSCEGLLRQVCPMGPAAAGLGRPAAAASLNALRFPFAAYRPGQRALGRGNLPGLRRRASRTQGRRPGCFARRPTGIGKTMSALFPALKAMGEGQRRKALLPHGPQHHPGRCRGRPCRGCGPQPRSLALRSVTLTAKEKACLCRDAEGHPVLSAGALPLRQRLLRPPQGRPWLCPSGRRQRLF